MDISVIENLTIDPNNDLFEISNIIQNGTEKLILFTRRRSLYSVLYYQLVRNYRNQIQTNNNTVSEETLLSAMEDTSHI